ncbi:MAG: type II toxin-antitoxin system HicA family toxin [Lentisphaeria bacterium]|nr:type II toxin-antitoxin system HicA family toxin [Lentisphaeria bacterium]
MNYNELTKLLKQAGWRFYRNGKGSHKIWIHPEMQYQIPIPDHGSKEIKPVLVKTIKKQAGIE